MRGASRLLAPVQSDGTAWLVDWHPVVIDIATGKTLFELEGHTKQVRDIGFIRTGRWLVTAQPSIGTLASGAPSRERVMAVLMHDAESFQRHFSPRTQWILPKLWTAVLRVWDARQPKKNRRDRVRLRTGQFRIES